MENNETQNNFDEAPASVTVKIKSPANFEYMFTMRDASAKNLLFKMKAMEAHWTQNGFTPLSQNVQRFQKKEPEYVEGKSCPTCGKRLIKGQSKDGTKKFEKCETNKFNFQTRQAEGCPFIAWL